ncbi:uncharacterized protein METZ01_LOCUS135751, partial [marine metagenome]
VSTITASFAGFKGLIFLFESFESRNFIAFLISSNEILLFVFLYSSNLLFALVFKEHLKNSFKSAFGIITVPMSRPSIIQSLFLAKFI